MVYSGATIMYLISKRLKKRYNLSDDVRKHIYDACNQWISELNGSSFHGGQTPNLADLAVFGALNSFEGCKAFEDIKNNTQIGKRALKSIIKKFYQVNNIIFYIFVLQRHGSQLLGRTLKQTRVTLSNLRMQ